MNWKVFWKSIIHSSQLVGVIVGGLLIATLPFLLSVGIPIVLALISHNMGWLFLYVPIGYGWIVYFDYKKRKETGKGLLDYLPLDGRED